METLKEIRVQPFNTFGTSVKAEDGEFIRLSIYFNYADDNHHIQIPVNANRKEALKALTDLSRLIAADI